MTTELSPLTLCDVALPLPLKPPMEVSFVVPMYNEEDNVAPLVAEILKAGHQLNRSFEIILVDDGSTDKTSLRLKELAQTTPQLKAISLRRNYGQTAATAAGFHYAQGRFIVTLDGDLQNDPADVPRLIDMMDTEQLDVITGWRKNRQDKALSRKLPSMIANALIAKHDGC
jgi:glycosyltransferase involved in cell wall biosynthesis